jgi:hypothetical protein
VAPNDGIPHTYVSIRAANGDVENYRDGAQKAGATAQAVLAESESVITLHGVNANLTVASGGTTSVALMWLRRLSPAEVAQVSANPWQLFKSPQRVMFAPSAGGPATYSYTAAGGFVLSGSATKVRGAVKTPAGGLALSGAATKVRGAVRSTSGGILFAGTAAQVRRRTIAPSGGLTLGGAASILRGVARAASGGVLFSGAAPVSFSSAFQSLVVNPVGGLLISGAAALVRACRRFASGGIALGGASGVVRSGAGPAAVFNQTTIMRADPTNRSVPAFVTSFCASSTMRSSFSQSTIMRDNPINTSTIMSDAAINRTANLL